MLAQLVYWTPRSRNEQGWIYKSAEDLERETGLSYREQHRVRATLRDRGLIEERYSRDEHRLYFRVIPDAIDELVPEGGAPDETSDAHLTKRHMAPDETSDGTLPFVGSYMESESTSESTPESGGHIGHRQDAKAGSATADDDDRLPPFSTQEKLSSKQTAAEQYSQRIDEFLDQVLSKFRGRADQEFLKAALEKIDQRAWAKGRRPGSANYFEAALENFLQDERDVVELKEELARRREVRDRWMPGFNEQNYSAEPNPVLTEDVRSAISESERTGRVADEILREKRLARAAVAS